MSLCIKMNKTLTLAIFLLCLSAITSCNKSIETTENQIGSDSMIQNIKIQNYPFLKEMYEDDYFPNFVVDKGKQILIRLCEAIEREKPTDAESVYKLTHAATEEFNELAAVFEDNGSEIETGAREAIGADFEYILKAYGFDLDTEDAIAPRDW